MVIIYLKLNGYTFKESSSVIFVVASHINGVVSSRKEFAPIALRVVPIWKDWPPDKQTRIQ